jgi:hypothetical protein
MTKRQRAGNSLSIGFVQAQMPEGKRWDDFYGFNKNGKWPVMFAVMLTGTFLICLGLMALQQ